MIYLNFKIISALMEVLSEIYSVYICIIFNIL